MPDQLEELPLFPLDAVLMPFARMPIHVFEPRYQTLIRACLQHQVGFGICLIKSGTEVGGPAEPYLVGTSCRIMSVQRHDDQAMDIIVEGSKRFRVRKLDDSSRPYLVGHVETLEEDEPADPNRLDALAHKTRELMSALIEQALRQAEMQITQIRLPDNPYALSFVVANFLTLGNMERQRLLEITDTSERLAELIPIILKHIAENSAAHYHPLTFEEMSEWISSN